MAANAFAGSDLEPERVGVNYRNYAVVSFQENNHFGVFDIVTGETISQFSAGSVDLENVDTVEDDLIILDSDISKRREPDAVESGKFRGRNFLFVGSERSNAVGVYDISKGAPSLVQALPTGIGPEGLKAIPRRNLLAVSTEADVAEDGIPTMINLFKYSGSKSRYPQIASGPDADGLHTNIGRYDVFSGEWTFVYYPLQPLGNGGWIGLSELTALPDGNFAVIERDKGWGPTSAPVAELKALFTIDLEGAEFRSLDDPNGLVTIEKTLLKDLLPTLSRKSIFTAEKL